VSIAEDLIALELKNGTVAVWGSFLHEKRDLPPDVAHHFTELGHAQRDTPEEAMSKLQHYHGGGVLSFAVEHIGDLTHRMAHHAKYGTAYHEIVKDKVDKTLRVLTNRYGFEREHKENMLSNANYRGHSPEEHTETVHKLLNDYADAHAKLPAYNRAHWLAREAAVSLGRGKFEEATSHLFHLKEIVDRGRKHFTKEALRYRRTPDGTLRQYTHHDEAKRAKSLTGIQI
jgi:nitrogen regulatory protein PII-like uncharacterized protein